MKKYEISIIKNSENNGTEELFWLPAEDDILVHFLFGITNALVEELDEYRDR